MTLFEIFDPKAAPRPIGIDLGTTNSLVAYVRDGRPEVIRDCDQEALVPSVVSYLPTGEIVVGRRAVVLGREHPKETFASIKRLIGRGANDAETKRSRTNQILANEEGGPNVVRLRAGDRTVTPVEVSAEILRSLKQMATDELRTVGGAVITVPAYFDDAQRQATKDAARLAGIDVLRLLNEPTAAALAYGLEKQSKGTFAVYDLGGGTFDVTILALDDGIFHVRSTGGDSALGGDDMDRAIAEDVYRQLRESGRLPSADMTAHESTDKALLGAVLEASRRMKHMLTESPRAEAEVAGTKVAITRETFERATRPLLERTGRACKRALADAGLEKGAIDGVILVGGATRVPAVRAYVKELFGREPLTDVNPDEVVALGAAAQADMLAGGGNPDDVLLLDVIPLSLGIEVGGGVADKIISRNTTIPTAARGLYTTQEDRQTGFELHVVQGEREMVKDCRSLARFSLRGIPPMPAGLAKLEVTFRIDADGLLSVSAKELTTGIEQLVTVKPSYGLDDATVEQMLLDALDHGESDLFARRLAEGRWEATRMIRATRAALAVDASLLAEGELAPIEDALSRLETAAGGSNPSRITAAVELLDQRTKEFAGRRMNAAIAQATLGHTVNEIEKTVEHSHGVEAAHALKSPLVTQGDA